MSMGSSSQPEAAISTVSWTAMMEFVISGRLRVMAFGIAFLQGLVTK
jgi:hypothetical protein